MADTPTIIKQYVYDEKKIKKLVYPKTKVAAIEDIADALFAFKEQFIDPEITVKTYEAETVQDALTYSAANPDVLVFIAKPE